jgi:hypothetical protein
MLVIWKAFWFANVLKVGFQWILSENHFICVSAPGGFNDRALWPVRWKILDEIFILNCIQLDFILWQKALISKDDNLHSLLYSHGYATIKFMMASSTDGAINRMNTGILLGFLRWGASYRDSAQMCWLVVDQMFPSNTNHLMTLPLRFPKTPRWSGDALRRMLDTNGKGLKRVRTH